nr:retrovirus-related Pol polyprotein from transposon TNT 1-94 [Tanacetum cinerariifolium]
DVGDDGEEGNDDDDVQDNDAQDNDDQEDEGNDENDQGEGSDDEQASNKEEFIHPRLSTHEEEETRDEESFDPIPKTPENMNDKGNGEENLGMNVGRDEGQDEEDEEDELYRDVNINLGRGIQMDDVHTTQEFKDSYLTLTSVNPDGQQQSSSVSSQFVTSMLNPTPDAGIVSIFERTSQMDVQILTSVSSLHVSAPTLTPSTIATITTTQQAPTPPKIAPSTLLQDLPNFGSLFRFDHRIKTLEANFSEFMQTNQFAGAVSSIPGIVQRYMYQRMNEAVKRNLYKALFKAYESNKIILDTYGDTVTLKRRHDDDADKDEEPSAGLDRGSKRRKEGKEPDPTKPEQDSSHTNRPTTPIIEDWVSDSEDESETKAPQIVPSFVQSTKQVRPPRHSIQLVETSIPADTPKPSKPVSITTVRPVSAAVPKSKVTQPIHATPIVTKTKSPIRRHLNRSPSLKTSNSPPRVTAVNALVVSAAQDNRVIDSGCSRHMTGKMSYLSYFEELNGGYVAFGGNLKGGKISRKGKNQDRSDNGTEFKNHDLNQFWGMKGLKREFRVPRTPQQNGVAERKNRTLIEAARTMLADSLLPIPFWAEAVNTACYLQNRVIVTKPHNKTHCEILHGRTSSIGFMRPFGYPVTILNTLDSLGKFDGKVDEGFLVGYSVSSKAFRVFNSRTCIVQEILHVNFLENKPNVTSSGPTWLFDIDSLTRTMNYQLVTTVNQTNLSAGFQNKFTTEKAREEINQQYVLFPVWSSGSTNPQNNDEDAAFDGKEPDFDAKKPESEVNVSPSSSAQSRKQDDKTKKEAKGKSPVESFTGYRDLSAEFKDFSDNSINEVTAVGTIVPTIRQNSPNSTNTFSAAGPSNVAASPTYRKSSFIDASQLLDDLDMPELEDITHSDDENDVGEEADFNNLETSITVSLIPTTRVHKDHPVSQIIGDLSSTT